MLGSLAALCVAAVLSVTVFGGTGVKGLSNRIFVGACVDPIKAKTTCDSSAAWYRVTSTAATPRACSDGHNDWLRYKDRVYCLDLLHPVKGPNLHIKIPDFGHITSDPTP